MRPQSNPRERVIEEFKNLYHTHPSFLVRAPGRVNLIGEHT
ncbi:MAG: galactokinase family protein, partial [SAR324 cluster bacterium]|nr:galactokinase family protein [SAR324 cluster bacterium]